jgi:hypothetical protein
MSATKRPTDKIKHFLEMPFLSYFITFGILIQISGQNYNVIGASPCSDLK